MHWLLRSTFIASSMFCISCFDLGPKPEKRVSETKPVIEEPQANSKKELYALFKPVSLKPIVKEKLVLENKPTKTLKKKTLKQTKQKTKKIKPLYKAFDVTLSPKKVDKHLYITKSTPINLNYEITDQTGKMIFEGEIKPNKNKLNMEDVNDGVYFFHVIFPDTNIKKAYRFIVDK
jgi:hypothetical protein